MSKPSVAIVGGGVAGASLGIRLANSGHEVSLYEKDKFPRQKLCGEFVSPECLRHFAELGVADVLLRAGGDTITETKFFAPSGRCVTVPSEWFGGDAQGALGISRAEMDHRLLEKARSAGVDVHENTVLRGVEIISGRIAAIRLRSVGAETVEKRADIYVDATGRAGVISKMTTKAVHGKNISLERAPKYVAFKTHLRHTKIERGVCEIYFFPGGYGGLSWVEGGETNCCFLMKAEALRPFGSDGNRGHRAWRELFLQNHRARKTMGEAIPVFNWLAVSVDKFGKKAPPVTENLFSAGDSAAFIDPFTGSGMLMALESSELLAKAIALGKNPTMIQSLYSRAYKAKFQMRLWACAAFHRASFKPAWAGAFIAALGWGKAPLRVLTALTRSGREAADDLARKMS